MSKSAAQNVGVFKLGAYISPLGALALAFGYAVGWGAFMMPGNVFLPGAGPLGTLLGIALGTLTMSVFAYNCHRMIMKEPGTGGAFAFARTTFGEDHGFLVGWFLWITYIAILWANATSIILQARFMFGDALQFGFHYTLAGFDIYFGEVLLSIVAIIATGLACLYRKTLAVHAQMALAFVMVAAVAVFIIFAFAQHDGGFEAMGPAFASGSGPSLQVMHILGMMPWAFVGFEAIANSSSEFKFPLKRSFAILTAAVVMAAAMYALLVIFPVMALPEGYAAWTDYIADLPNLSGIDSIPVFAAAKKTFGVAGIALASTALLAAQLTGIIAAYIAMGRLMHAMSRDRILPRWFGRLDRSGSPRNAILFVMLVSLAVPFLGRTVIEWPIDVSSIGAAISLGYTSAAVLKRCREGSNAKRALARFCGVSGIVMSVFFCALLLVPKYISGSMFSAGSYLVLALWCIAGFLFYRSVYGHEDNHEYGKSTVVWMSLIGIIIFSSLMWVRQASCDSMEKGLRNISAGGAVEAEMGILNNSMLWNALVEMCLLMASLAVMMSLYKILRAREQRMAVEKANVEEVNKAKSYFFSTVSHDIRTPLNAIIGFAQMLKAGFKTQEEHDQAVDSICVSGTTLLKLINDVLDLSKLESGKMEIIPEPVRCDELVAEIAEAFKVAASESGLEIRSSISDMPALMLDAQRMRQIAFNLMGNAVKFTKKGFIEVRASFSPSEDGPYGVFRLEVEDSGCGISEADQKRIASPYVQVGAKDDRQAGTGLGLAISRQLANAMGGELKLKSELGKGSTFSVVIPGVKIVKSPDVPHSVSASLAAAALPAAAPMPRMDASKVKRILIADDQKMNVMVLKAMLARIGRFEIDAVNNGREAYEAVTAGGGGRYDMVLTDMWMPEMDGEAFVRAVRANPKIAKLPVYVITADVEAQKCYAEHGFTGILIKPVTLEGLHAIFA